MTKQHMYSRQNKLAMVLLGGLMALCVMLGLGFGVTSASAATADSVYTFKLNGWYQGTEIWASITTDNSVNMEKVFYDTGYPSFVKQCGSVSLNNSANNGNGEFTVTISFADLYAYKYGSSTISEGTYRVAFKEVRYDGDDIDTFNHYDETIIVARQTVPLPADPVKDGYTFNGWYYNEALTIPYVSGDPVYADTSLFAKFTPITYAITYNLNGGSMTGQATSYNIETATYTLPTPSKTGYNFGGWYTAANFSGSPVTTIAKGSMGNMTFYAKFTPVSYSVTYQTNGGTISGQTTSYTIESASITLVVPTKTGYDFGGWFTQSDFSGAAVTTIATGSTGDKTYYAKFTPVSYTITYELNGGTISGQTTSYTIESASITLVVPTKTGYDFGGWFTQSNFSGAAVSTIGTGSTGNKTFYAKFTPISYSITYQTNGGTVSGQPTSYTIESAAVLPTPVKTGYDFGGWYMAADFTGAVVNAIAAGSTGDKTVYAKFTPVSYTVSYYLNGGSMTGQRTEYTIENDLYALPTPTREGYTFDGWFNNASLTGAAVSDIAAGSTGNKAFYAKWTIIMYTVTFYVDGNVYQQISVAYGSAFSGYTFVNPETMQAVRMYADADKTAEFNPAIAVYGNMALFASEGYELYVTLIYSVNGIETETIMPYNSTLDNLRTAEREGYTFDGWFYDETCTRKVAADDKITTITKIYAKFTPIAEPTFGDAARDFFAAWWWIFVLGAVMAVVGVVFVKRARR